MNEIIFPTQSTKTLIKAAIAAIFIAVVIFITVVLPSEFNRDPTGMGEKLGLSVLAQNVPVAAPPEAIVTVAESSLYPFTETETTVEVPANRGIEYKFLMQQFGKITYEWSTPGTPLYFDFHGEPKGDTTGYFESYTIATADKMKGSMTVPFDGSHGWFWKNTTDEPVIVTLITSGNYQIKK